MADDATKPERKPGKDTLLRDRAERAEADEDRATERAWEAIERRATAAETDRDYWRTLVVRLVGLGGVLLLITLGVAIGLTAFDGEIPGVGKLSFRSEENAPRAEGNEGADSGVKE